MLLFTVAALPSNRVVSETTAKQENSDKYWSLLHFWVGL
jgi:hypothetical protein